MPMVAVSPLTRTHSCDLAYFRSEGTLLINYYKTCPQITQIAQILKPTKTKYRAKLAQAAQAGIFTFVLRVLRAILFLSYLFFGLKSR
jgi:hypothetical protein